MSYVMGKAFAPNTVKGFINEFRRRIPSWVSEFATSREEDQADDNSLGLGKKCEALVLGIIIEEAVGRIQHGDSEIPTLSWARRRIRRTG